MWNRTRGSLKSDCSEVEACVHLFFMCLAAPPCFDFGLPAVLGIAFGGFLIGMLLIGALWFIKIKTGKCVSGVTFLISYWVDTKFWFSHSLIQVTRPDWTWAQPQRIFLVRHRFLFLLSFALILFSFLFFILIGVSSPLLFPQAVPAQARKGNLSLPTHPPRRTVAPTPASEAPRARRPAAWHEIVVAPHHQQHHWVPSKSLIRVLCFGFPSIMLKKHYSLPAPPNCK